MTGDLPIRGSIRFGDLEIRYEPGGGRISDDALKQASDEEIRNYADQALDFLNAVRREMKRRKRPRTG